mmetsp:Transcript_28703/g.66847  ORF Transcript_28703/g.66847 Transcript_28703/m.66847 type:complete len:230 (+) Transcript_28703:1034-1723(+)
MSACLMTLRLMTTVLLKALRVLLISSAMFWSTCESCETASNMPLYLLYKPSATSVKSQPLDSPIWTSSHSNCSVSDALRSEAWVSCKLLTRARCAGRSRSCMPRRTSPFALTAASTEVRQSISSSAACRLPLEVAGTILNTMFRLRWRSPAADSNVLPLSLTVLSVDLNSCRISAASCARINCFSLNSSRAFRAASSSARRTSSKGNLPQLTSFRCLGQSSTSSETCGA